MSHSQYKQQFDAKRQPVDYDEYAEAVWEIAERARMDRLDQAGEIEHKEQS